MPWTMTSECHFQYEKYNSEFLCRKCALPAVRFGGWSDAGVGGYKGKARLLLLLHMLRMYMEEGRRAASQALGECSRISSLHESITAMADEKPFSFCKPASTYFAISISFRGKVRLPSRKEVAFIFSKPLARAGDNACRGSFTSSPAAFIIRWNFEMAIRSPAFPVFVIWHI